MAIAVPREGGVVYAAMGQIVWGLDAASGAVLWHWQWRPLSTSGRLAEPTPVRSRPIGWSRLAEFRGGVAGVIGWLAADEEPNVRADVILLSSAGQLLFQQTAPVHSPGRDDYPSKVFVKDTTIVLWTGGRWETWTFAGE